jgi:hypothetical protein
MITGGGGGPRVLFGADRLNIYRGPECQRDVLGIAPVQLSLPSGVRPESR